MRLHKSDSRQPPPSHQGLSAVSVALAFLICVGGNGTQQAAAQTLQGGVSTNEYAPAPAPAPSGPPTMPTGPTGAGDIGAGGTGAGDSFGLGGAIGGIVGGVLSGLLSHGNSAPAQRYDKTYGEIYQDAAQADAAINRDAAPWDTRRIRLSIRRWRNCGRMRFVSPRTSRVRWIVSVPWSEAG